MATTEITPASSPAPAADADWEFLQAACSVLSESEKHERLRALLRQPVRWEAVLDLADRQGVLFLLYRPLSGGLPAVPAQVLRVLQERYQANLHKNLLLARELIRVLDRLDQLGIEVMPYKGVPLAEQVYGDMALRPSGDVDLLIRPADFPRIKQAVRDLGYVPHEPLSQAEERVYLHSGYECAFDSPVGRNLLEVQWAIQPRFYAVDLDMNALFQRAVPATVAGHPTKTPSLEDQLLILSVHAAKHAWNRFLWLCDIARIAQLPTLNWQWIEREAHALGIARILRVTFLLTNRFLGSAIPPPLKDDVQGDRPAGRLAEEIAGQIAQGNSCDVESLAYFRLMVRLRERAADQMRFLKRLALTPGPGEWKAVRLPPPLFPLYRLVRLSRLAARLARA